MARRTVEAKGSTGSKLLGLLVIAGLIYWAGRDPAGAAIVIRHVGEGIANFVHGVTRHTGKHS